MLKTRFLENDQVRLEMGIDEVGRGPMFGRVYAGAVILPISSESFEYERMKDSKKFTSAKKLKETAHYIMEHAIAWSVAYEEADVIDQINILQATQSAMRKAIRSVLMSDAIDKTGTIPVPYLLVDGNCFKPMVNPLSKTTALMEYTTVIGGDNTYCSIAAASILAKWHRDQYIAELCETYPELIERYNLDSNKGYGTKQHINGIKQHGITQWHRRSFGICNTSTFNPC